MSNNEKVANLNVHIKSFFRQWILFTKPFHKLNNQQQEVLSLLLYYHYQLKHEITNNKILWKEVFDYDTKVKIYTELNIQPSALENLLSQLRKRKIIVENKISPVYIPDISKNSKVFTIKFNFNIKHE
jgi:hypothetical protein